MTSHADKLVNLRRHIAALPEDDQREIRRAHRDLLWMVRRYGDVGPVALSLLAAEVLDMMERQDSEP
jgi:hypothetical protein